MNQRPALNPDVYYRLTGLWILCEAMLGGAIHGLRIPISGLVVGSAAVTCICLIAWYIPHKGAILKATLIVAVFKMIMSPQASFPAYIAVFFQGALGEVLFWNRKYYRISCLLLAVLSLLESGLQRILVLTIVYGNDLWVVVNNFINGITNQARRTNYSFLIGTIYVGIHFVTGILVGWMAGMLPRKIEKFQAPAAAELAEGLSNEIHRPTSVRKRKRRLFFIIWVILLFIFVQSELAIGNPLLPPALPLRVLIRSLIVVGAWVLIVSPVLNSLLKSWLSRKQSKWKNEIASVTRVLPSLEMMIRKSWKQSAEKKGFNRVWRFAGILLSYVVKNDMSVYIFSRPIHSGKTTSLESWVRQQKSAGGILTPIRKGKRVFLDIRSGEEFPMEVEQDEDAVLIGRYKFNAASFTKAISILKTESNVPGWLVIDEIGPLELKNEGFAQILFELLQNPRKNILIVVREGLADEVVKKFGISNYILADVLPA